MRTVAVLLGMGALIFGVCLAFSATAP